MHSIRFIGRRRLAGRITDRSSDSRGKERERKLATTLNKRIPPPWMDGGGTTTKLSVVSQIRVFVKGIRSTNYLTSRRAAARLLVNYQIVWRLYLLGGEEICFSLSFSLFLSSSSDSSSMEEYFLSAGLIVSSKDFRFEYFLSFFELERYRYRDDR